MTSILNQAMNKAFSSNNIEAIKRCYRAGARVDTRELDTQLSRGNIKPETLEFLFKIGVEPTKEMVESMATQDKPQLLEVALNALREPGEMLNQRSVSTASGQVRAPLLSVVAARGHEEVVRCLLAYGASPTLTDSANEPPLHYALLGYALPIIHAIENAARAERKQMELANSEDHDIELQLADQLSRAIYFRDMEGIRQVFEAGPPVRAPFCADYWFHVVDCKNPLVTTIANLLVEKGVSPFKAGNHQLSPFDHAVLYADVQMLDLFLSLEPEHLEKREVYGKGTPAALEETPLGNALTKQGYYGAKQVQYLLKKCASLDLVNILGESAEMVAERCGSVMTKRLMDEFNLTGRVPEFTVEFGPDYAAATAVENGDIAALREIQSSGKLDLKDVRIGRHTSFATETLLEFVLAVRLPYEKLREVAQYLVSEAGLTLSEVSDTKGTLERLIVLGDAPLLEIVLGSLNEAERREAIAAASLLYVAVAYGNQDIIRDLLTWGADPLQKTHGKSPLESLETNHRYLTNYDDVWKQVHDAEEAAKAALALMQSEEETN